MNFNRLNHLLIFLKGRKKTLIIMKEEKSHREYFEMYEIIIITKDRKILLFEKL